MWEFYGKKKDGSLVGFDQTLHPFFMKVILQALIGMRCVFMAPSIRNEIQDFAACVKMWLHY